MREGIYWSWPWFIGLGIFFSGVFSVLTFFVGGAVVFSLFGV